MNKSGFCMLWAFALMPCGVLAWEACGEDSLGKVANCEYQIVDGTLTIRGTSDKGNIGRWQARDNPAPWSGQHVQNVVIESSIKDLGYQGFTYLKSDTPIVVPSSVKKISGDAFKYVKTSEVIIPDSVTSIEGYAFRDATIDKITIPDSVTSIGVYAFSNSNLQEIIIPDSVQTLGTGSLGGCSNLKTVVIGENVLLGNIFNDNRDYAPVNLENLQMYCSAENTSCESALKSIGATDEQIQNVLKTYTKEGNRYVIDGQRYKSLSDMKKNQPLKLKRIYTLDEAAKVSTDKNRLMIRYR